MVKQLQPAGHPARRSMMLRLLLRAISHRPAKLITIVAALAVGATLASAFLSLYFDLPAKMTSEFRTLGPNLLIAPADSQPSRGSSAPTHAAEPLLDQRVAASAQSAAPESQMLPWLYAVAQVDRKATVLAGTDVRGIAKVHPSWQVKPLVKETSAPGVFAGERAAALHGWSVEPASDGSTPQWVTINYGGAEHHFPLVGIVSTGSATDDQVIVSLPVLQEITGQAGKMSTVEIAAIGDAAQIDHTLHTITAALTPTDSSATVRALRPVIESQARVIMKVQGLMLGLTAVVLALVLLSVMVTISGLVLDRSREIGVMKALGGSNARIQQFLMAETSLLAFAAALAGYFAGFGLARIAAQRIFTTAAESPLLSLRGDVFAAVVGITVAVALAACALPARQMKHMDPAVILRGE